MATKYWVGGRSGETRFGWYQQKYFLPGGIKAMIIKAAQVIQCQFDSHNYADSQQFDGVFYPCCWLCHDLKKSDETLDS